MFIFEIGIFNENQPTASVEKLSIGYDNVSFTAYISDPEKLISATDGAAYAVLYDGDVQLLKVELPLGIGAAALRHNKQKRG